MERFLQNPRHPDVKPAFIYVKPASLSKATPETIVIYEAPDPTSEDDSVCAAFGDGHCERMTHAEFQSRLTKANGQ
jgi:hypothetical protein